MPKHWHAGYNTSGYSPEMDVEYHETKRDAVASAKWWRKEILESGYGPMIAKHEATGAQIRRGNYLHTKSSDAANGDYWLGDNEMGHLDVHIWVSECHDDDCKPEEWE